MNTTDTTITTKSVLDDVTAIRRVISQIGRARSTWKKYQKTAKERNFTAEQIASAKQVLRESVAGSLAVLIERGMHISQMDEADIDVQSEAHAANIIA